MIVSSNIIDKFYTDIEKIGFKKHKISDNEIKYLESLDKDTMSLELINETEFHIQRIKIKLIFTKIFSLFFLLLSLINLNFNIISFSFIFVSILFFINIRVLNKRLKYHYFSKGLCLMNIDENIFDNLI